MTLGLALDPLIPRRRDKRGQAQAEDDEEYEAEDYGEWCRKSGNDLTKTHLRRGASSDLLSLSAWGRRTASNRRTLLLRYTR